VDRELAQRRHWDTVFIKHPTMYGPGPSAPALEAIALFQRLPVRAVLELGGGQGRDTLALLDAGFEVTALDYAESALDELRARARAAGHEPRLQAAAHDVRHPCRCPMRRWTRSTRTCCSAWR